VKQQHAIVASQIILGCKMLLNVFDFVYLTVFWCCSSCANNYCC